MPVIALKKNPSNGLFRTMYSIVDSIHEIDKNDKSDFLLVDLTSPTQEEIRIIREKFFLDIPSEEEMDLREVKTPFEVVKQSLGMKNTAIIDSKDESYNITITALQGTSAEFESFALTFNITQQYLIIAKHDNAPQLENFIRRLALTLDTIPSPESLLLNIIEYMIDNVATILEAGGNEIDSLLLELFDEDSISEIKDKNDEKKVKRHKDRYKEVLRKIGKSAQLISKCKESLMTINRMLIYYLQSKYHTHKNRDNRVKVNKISREIHSLGEYANFLSQRNAFIFDAGLGVISLEQGKMLKVFTIASAVFMIPTFVAGVYGMNFAKLPGLQSLYGPIAVLVIMVLSMVGTIAFFKMKKWM